MATAFQEYTKPTSSKRLLILNGHGSHHTIEFIKYCEAYNTILFGMPPNLTHILQPLDVVVFQPLKHYHAKALDILVRDGIAAITASKMYESRLSKGYYFICIAKKGIWPFNPQPVIQILKQGAPIRTPSLPLISYQNSSDFETPTTLRKINKVADKISEVLEADDSIDDDFAYNISRFVCGTLIAASELVQTKRDLGRTKAAQILAQQRSASKNRPLKSGGILSVADGRQMVKKKDEGRAQELQRTLNATKKKECNFQKRIFFGRRQSCTSKASHF